MCIYLANDNSLSFTDSNSAVFNGNFDVSGLSKFSTVFTKLELVEESVEAIVKGIEKSQIISKKMTMKTPKSNKQPIQPTTHNYNTRSRSKTGLSFINLIMIFYIFMKIRLPIEMK